MQTPFFGLTVIFHLVVIFGRWLFIGLLHRIEKEKISEGGKHQNSIYANLVIIVTVFALISFTALITIKNSINNQYSNVNLVEKYYKKTGKPFIVNTMLIFSQSADKMLGNENLGLTTCPESVDDWQSGTAGLMLVNYMIQSQREHNFNDRSVQAMRFGLYDYHGTASENIWLLQQLQKEDGKQSFNATTCKK